MPLWSLKTSCWCHGAVRLLVARRRHSLALYGNSGAVAYSDRCERAYVTDLRRYSKAFWHRFRGVIFTKEQRDVIAKAVSAVVQKNNDELVRRLRDAGVSI